MNVDTNKNIVYAVTVEGRKDNQETIRSLPFLLHDAPNVQKASELIPFLRGYSPFEIACSSLQQNGCIEFRIEAHKYTEK
jgi:hypothetical protein